ncbi:MAG: indolepyruvate ferredoxin oxidoreductase subunit alpha [Oscillospiraceae bacterium]|jgi:indolepyruvate ferredoxin oxidoreductase alpha subunit|nr:indolepyruvate ferredoxin oxidoreductase subunit alpha [Oscillospiraceae bacterium]
MERRLLMGNEAIALGAVRAGVTCVTGYPGTPSTEILETVARLRDERIYTEWSVNEKSALEVAAGAACAGARAMVTMKQVGLNVASDPLMSLNYVGVRGALVVVVADDPGPISSQTEQDTRHFGLFAKLAVFDPSTPEEAYLMAADAFACSEAQGRPVLLRPTTRVCHSYASVTLLDELPRRVPEGFSKDGGRWVIFPRLSYQNHLKIESELHTLRDTFSDYPRNILTGRGRLGIAAGGVSYTYVREALADAEADCKLLKVSTVPFPEALGLSFLEGLDEVLVAEELDPVIEDALVRLCGRHGLRVTVRGKGTGDMPNAGENTVAGVRLAVRRFLHLPTPGDDDQKRGIQHTEEINFSVSKGDGQMCGIQHTKEINFSVSKGDGTPEEIGAAPTPPARPPVLCAGCPHRGAFFAVKEAVGRRKAVYSGDIGCYTLGNAPPLDMVDTCLCMGAGLTMAQGLDRVEPDVLHFAFLGDSTFFHSGLPGLVNAVYNGADVILCILDNGTTAMTGHQPHPGIGRTATGAAAAKVDIHTLVSALGVAALARVDALDLAAAKQAVTEMLDIRGVRVLLFEGPCVAICRGGVPCAVDDDACTGCGRCVRQLGCPALARAPESRKARIDPVLCAGCRLCAALCPVSAIKGGGRPC